MIFKSFTVNGLNLEKVQYSGKIFYLDGLYTTSPSLEFSVFANNWNFDYFQNFHRKRPIS